MNVHTPYAVNQQLKKIMGLYNNRERYRAAEESRDPFLLPDISAHNLPYTIVEELRETEYDPLTVQMANAYQAERSRFQKRYTSGA